MLFLIHSYVGHRPNSISAMRPCVFRLTQPFFAFSTRHLLVFSVFFFIAPNYLPQHATQFNDGPNFLYIHHSSVYIKKKNSSFGGLLETLIFATLLLLIVRAIIAPNR